MPAEMAKCLYMQILRKRPNEKFFFAILSFATLSAYPGTLMLMYFYFHVRLRQRHKSVARQFSAAVSAHARFSARTFQRKDVSAQGRFSAWTFQRGRFSARTFQRKDVSAQPFQRTDVSEQ
jgi:hypothetical protein